MKHEEAFKKTLRVFRDDEKDALLRLAILKERADYRKYFTPDLRKAVESAWSELDKEAAKGPGHFEADEGVYYTGANFLGTLRHRFSIRQLGIPPYFTSAEWLDVLDPLVDVWAIPARVRRRVLPRLFYTRGVNEVVPKPGQPSKGHPYETGGIFSPDCAPYERLLKIDLRKKPVQLFREFKAVLTAVDARRGMDPAAYETWKQDRSRKREEAWQHLQVWRMRRERKNFGEIARTMSTPSKKVTIATAKKSFYRAYELIEERPYHPEDFRRTYWEVRKAELKRTCAICPDRNNCTVLCPDVLPFIEQDTQKYILGRTVGGIAEVLPHKGRKRACPTMDQQDERSR